MTNTETTQAINFQVGAIVRSAGYGAAASHTYRVTAIRLYGNTDRQWLDLEVVTAPAGRKVGIYCGGMAAQFEVVS